MNKCCILLLILFHTSLSAGDEVHFRNWKELRDNGIEKQDLDVSCGSAAAATILNGYYGVAVSEQAILTEVIKAEIGVTASALERDLMTEIILTVLSGAQTIESLKKNLLARLLRDKELFFRLTRAQRNGDLDLAAQLEQAKLDGPETGCKQHQPDSPLWNPVTGRMDCLPMNSIAGFPKHRDEPFEDRSPTETKQTWHVLHGYDIRADLADQASERFDQLPFQILVLLAIGGEWLAGSTAYQDGRGCGSEQVPDILRRHFGDIAPEKRCIIVGLEGIAASLIGIDASQDIEPFEPEAMGQSISTAEEINDRNHLFQTLGPGSDRIGTLAPERRSYRSQCLESLIEGWRIGRCRLHRLSLPFRSRPNTCYWSADMATVGWWIPSTRSPCSRSSPCGPT